MELELSQTRVGDVITVTAGGEIDYSNADAFHHEIALAHSAAPDSIVVDVSAVTFMDSAGINALLDGRRVADRNGTQYTVTGAAGRVREVLELTGVWEYLSGQLG